MKKTLKGFLSLLLVVSIMASLPVLPFNIIASTVDDEEPSAGSDAATGSDIYAFLNKINPDRGVSYNLELVFKSENVKDPNYVAGPFTDFADTEYVTTNYAFDDTGRQAKTWTYYDQWNTAAEKTDPYRLPWSSVKDSSNNFLSNKGAYIRKVVFQDKIAPKSIAGWFYNMRALVKFVNFENLDVSRCENMSFAFWGMNMDANTTSGITETTADGTFNYRGQVLESLDFSGWDTSKCHNFDCFLRSKQLKSLNLSNFTFAGLKDNVVTVAKKGTPTYDSNGKRTAGFPQYTGAIRSVSCFVYQCEALETVKLDGFDFADIEFLASFLVGSKALTTIDLRTIQNDPKHLYSAENMFSANSNLQQIIFGEEGNPFEIGTEPMYMGFPRNGNVDPLEPNKVNSSGNYVENGYKANSVWLGNFISGCSSLETVDLKYLCLNGFGKHFDGTPYPPNSSDRDAENLGYGVRYQLNNFFSGCTNLERIDHLENLCFMTNYSGNWNTRMMFQDCPKLTEIDLSKYWGNLGGPCIFQNCSSLKKLDLSNMGRAMITPNPSKMWYTSVYDIMSKGFYSYYDVSATSKIKPNIFEGCTELSEVSLSPYYPGAVPSAYYRQNNVINTTKKAVTAEQALTYVPNSDPPYTNIEKDIPPVDPNALWTKIADPDPDDFTLSDLNGKYYQNATAEFNTNLDTTTLYAVNGDPLTTTELFGNFKPEYAGTWVRTSKIALVAKGSNIAMQTIDGAVGLPVAYTASDIQTPVRPGFKFLGWVAYDDDGNEIKNLADQLEANEQNPNSEVFAAWSYYAKWQEHTYTLVLDGNGGKSDNNEDSFTANGGDPLRYSQYYELNNSMFKRSGSVLSGWTTRRNGDGEKYAPNESVAKLSTVDGATVTLYAQWHEPQLILHLDANYEDDSGNTPSMPDLYYDLPAEYGILPEPDPRDNYTFIGWWTTEDPDEGHKVEADDSVTSLIPTLYAQWRKDPVVTFDANGGHFETKESHNQPTFTRVYKYNQQYGVIPTPVHETAVMGGWYSKNGTTSGDWGNLITSAAENAWNGGKAIDSPSERRATEAEKTYYAKWGYQPQFESGGGVYATFGDYPIQYGSTSYQLASSKYAAEHPSSTIPTLPTFRETEDRKAEDFLGWYFINNDGSEGANVSAALAASPDEPYTLDLTQGKILRAKWKARTEHEVILEAGDNSSLDAVYLGKKANGDSYFRIKYYDGNTIEELPVPTRVVGNTVYEFLGWYTGPDGTGEKKDYNYQPPAQDTTLYAYWAPKNVTVTFDAGDGTLFLQSDSTMKVSSGGSVQYLPGANRSGEYIFGGWYTDLEDESTALTLSTQIAADTTYYAKWITSSEYVMQAADGLYEYAVKWDTKSNEYATNIGDNLIIAPSNGDAALSATAYIRFAFNTDVARTEGKELPPYSVKIQIPKHIFQTKTGEWIGSDNIHTGFSQTDTKNSHFIYQDDPDSDYYIVTNNEAITQSSAYSYQVIKISYQITPSELCQIDGGYVDEYGRYSDSCFKNSPAFTIQVDRDPENDEPDPLDTNYTKSLDVEVHTKVSASTEKTRTSFFFEWQNSWGPAPQDADQYFYVEWNLRASFNSGCSQQFKFSWSEEPVHDGSIIFISYGSNYSPTEYMSPGVYNTKVVTKHARTSDTEGWQTVHNEAVLNVESLSDGPDGQPYKQQFRAGKSAGVYVERDNDEGPVFEKKYLGKRYGTDPVKKGATELILNRTGVDNLRYEIEYYEYKNKDADKEWYPATGTYSVAEREMRIIDGATRNGGDVVMSRLSGDDRYNWNSSSNVTLSDSDYSFTKLDIYLTEFDSIKVLDDNNANQDNAWSEPFVHTATGDYGNVEIWVRKQQEEKFYLSRTLTADDFREPSSTDEYVEYGAVIAAGVELPPDTAGYQVVYKSSFFTTRLIVCPTLFLKSTTKVFDFVQTNMLNNVNTLIKNNSTLYFDNDTSDDTPGETRQSKKEFVPGSTTQVEVGGAQICCYELAQDESYLYARVTCATNQSKYDDNLETGIQTFPVLLSAWGINATGSFKPMQAGVFYNLLPQNYTVDKSTLFVKGRRENNGSTNSSSPHNYDGQLGENNFPSSLYTVELIENWEGSGCTMLKVAITGLPDGYVVNGFNVYYKMKTTRANILANGATPTTYVSFTDMTESQVMPVARYGEFNDMDAVAKPYYTGIKNAYQVNTAFNSHRPNCIMPSSLTLGLNSQVKVDGSFLIDGENTAGLSSDYTYNVTYSNGDIEPRNIIIYDIVEGDYTYQVTENNYTTVHSEWRGTFQDVDVSSIAKMQSKDSTATCAPKVYYLVKDGTITEEDLDLDNNPEWSAEVPANKALIKAIAIDCRTNSANGSFILPQNKALTYNVRMRSKDHSDENDLVTYNVAVVDALDGSNTSVKLPATVADLALHYATPEISKQSFPASGKDADHRMGVVNGSTIDYSIVVTNPDPYVPIRDIVIVDPLNAKLRVNDTPKIIRGSVSTPVSIGIAAGVSYSVSSPEDGNTLTVTIDELEKGETLTILVPATVTGASKDYPIDNTAYITRANQQDLTEQIPSNTTYHIVSTWQAKIKKVDANHEGLAGATLQLLDSDNTVLYTFTSDDDVMTFDLNHYGNYTLREVSTPDSRYYKLADDIHFTVDSDGINRVNNAPLDYVEMVDEPIYKIVFHENQPDHEDVVFKTYGPKELTEEYKIDHFYDIPSFAGDEYVFAGWYHTADYSASRDAEMTAVKFAVDTYPKTSEENPADYHLYAQWIQVGTLTQAEADKTEYGPTGVRGFGLVDAQIRDPELYDSNHSATATDSTPEGLRFVTSLGEDLLESIGELYDQSVEYGYVVATKDNIDTVTKHYGLSTSDLKNYKLQYKGRNVNGVDTTGLDENGERFKKDANGQIILDDKGNKVLALGEDQLSAANDFVYVTNMDCTSQKGKGVQGEGSTIKDDHRNYDDYRLYTLVVTYEGNDAVNKNQKIVARAYLRYTDANGMVRVFYNDYKKNLYNGGCMSNFDEKKALVRPPETTTDPTDPGWSNG